MRASCVSVLALASFVSSASHVEAETEPSTGPLLTTLSNGTPMYRKATTAVRRKDSIQIDGDISEAAWQSAPMTRAEWQQVPVENGKATGPTDFRIAYDDEAVYVSVHAFDPEPDKIAGLLFRPFGFRKVPQSDWILVYFSPTRDRSVGYAFAVNPAAVKIDFRLTKSDYDETYNGIWEAATKRDATGWYVEYKIPYSQMRVDSGYHESWGFQIERKWSRSQEQNYWSPLPITWSQELLAMGDLAVKDRISPGRSFELLPYVVGGSRLQTVAGGDKLNDSIEPAYGVGADLKLQLTGGLKLTAAINPDFGQIEADPAEVNLTDRETFFTERRPLFTEDADLYSAAIAGSENLFYSRRIGARPHFSLSDTAVAVDEDDVTTIYGAAKLSGTAPGGVKVGVLSALGAREKARGQLDTGDIVEEVIEPTTLYHVGQLGKSLRGGATEIRLAGTAVNRFLDSTPILELHRDAYAGAAKILHQFADGEWAFNGMVSGSRVAGDALAIERTQRASQRYFQRPDATHLELDPTLTSLTGYAANARIAKTSGTWLASFGVDGRSPGFEVNDIGFLLDADSVATAGSVGYQKIIKEGWVRQFIASANLQTVTDFAPDVLRHQATFDTQTTTRKNWIGLTSVGYTRQVLNTRLLRGGPAVVGDDTVEGAASLYTNQSTSVRLRFSLSGARRLESRSWRARGLFEVQWDAMPNLEIAFAPSYQRNKEDTQFIRTVVDGMNAPHYILGRLHQSTLVATTRINYTIRPSISLQFYGEPFLSAGRFVNFKEAANVRSGSYGDRFSVFDAAQAMESMGTVNVDVDRDGASDFSFARPDFQVGSLLTNFVFRWEYRPGSTFYLIWSQSRAGFETDGRIDSADIGGVFTNDSVHVVLAKLSFWANL